MLTAGMDTAPSAQRCEHALAKLYCVTRRWGRLGGGKMPAQPTTRLQVSGYRFLVRRMEHALVRRDVRMLGDPMRSQTRAMVVGGIVTTIGLAACLVLALIRPQDKIADNKIVVGKDSGAMFVVIGDTVHPVLNLASARLISGESAKPAIVKEAELGKKPRGPLVGIPGAPSALPFDSDADGRAWTVCDSIASDGSSSITTSVLIGDPELGDRSADLAPGDALLLRAGNVTYLVYDGKRARIDPADRAVVAALALDGATPRPVSPGLLNAIPEVDEIAPPTIEGAGGVPNYPFPVAKVGAVVQSARSEGNQYYVVLRDGLQAIGSATKDLIRYTDSQGMADIEKIAPDKITAAPQVASLDVASFPDAARGIADIGETPVTCLSWQPITSSEDEASAAEITVLTGRGLPMSDDARLVDLAQADGSGDKADAVYVRPGAGAFVQTTGIAADSQRRDSKFYVADTGVRYGIVDDDAAKALGFTRPESAPWPIVALLAPGPALGREEALLAHDGVAPDPAPALVSDR